MSEQRDGAGGRRADEPSERVRVLLADDQQLVRAGFRMVLERDASVEVVAEAATGAQAVDLARLHRPDVVLMDVRMPDVDGIEATRRIRGETALHGVHVVVLTTYELDEYIVAAIDAGATGFLVKDVEPDELRRAVQAAAAGEGLLSAAVITRVIAALRDRAGRAPREPERLDALTEREREVLMLVGRGANNDEIGRELYMAAATAKTHVGRIMAKLHARDRVQLVVIAHETGLVPGSA